MVVKAKVTQVCVAYQKTPPIDTMQGMDERGHFTFPYSGEYLLCRKGKLYRASFKAGETVSGVTWVLGDMCSGYKDKKKESKCE